MRHVSLGVLALLAAGILFGCSSEKPIPEDQSIASALKDVDPNSGPSKGSQGATKVDPNKPGG
jgi:hypothetical protein